MKRPASLRHLLLALPLLAALLCTSCQRHSAVWPQLLEAEALLDTDLPAAASLLDSVDATPLRGEDAALYAILKTQADYKRYVPLTSDSLPRLATDYYGTPYRKNYHAAMAWYSLGCYYTELKDDVQAIDAYLKAKDCFPDTTIRYYALCEQNLGRHYMNQHMYDEATAFLSHYYDYALVTNDSSALANAAYLLGQNYVHQSRFEEAEKLFHSIRTNPYSSAFIRNDVFYQLAKIAYHQHKDYSTSASYLQQYFSNATSNVQSNASWELLGFIMQDTNHPDSALHCYERALVASNDIPTRCYVYRRMADLAMASGDNDLMKECTDKYIELSDSVYALHYLSEIDSIQTAHALTLHARHVASVRHLSIFGTLAAVFLLLSLLLLANRKKLKAFVSYTKTSTQLRKEELSSRLVSEEGDVSQSQLQQQRLMDSYRQRIALCREQFRQSAYHTALFKMRNNPARALSYTDAEKKKLEDFVDGLTTDLQCALSADCPSLTLEDVNFCKYYLLGFSTQMLSLLKDCSDGALRTRKSRIKSRVNDIWRTILEEQKEVY